MWRLLANGPKMILNISKLRLRTYPRTPSSLILEMAIFHKCYVIFVLVTRTGPAFLGNSTHLHPYVARKCMLTSSVNLLRNLGYNTAGWRILMQRQLNLRMMLGPNPMSALSMKTIRLLLFRKTSTGWKIGFYQWQNLDIFDNRGYFSSPFITMKNVNKTTEYYQYDLEARYADNIEFICNNIVSKGLTKCKQHIFISIENGITKWKFKFKTCMNIL